MNGIGRLSLATICLAATTAAAWAQAGVEAGALGAASATAGSAAGKSTGGALGGAFGRIGGGLGAAAGGSGSAGGAAAKPTAPAPETAPLSMGHRRPYPGNWVSVTGANPAPAAKVWAPANADVLGKGFLWAKVHRSAAHDPHAWYGTRVDSDGRFTISGMPLSGLLWLGFAGPRQVAQIAGGPDWIDSDLWDIDAQMDDADMAGWSALTEAQRLERVRPQLRALLAEQFGVRMHTEMRMTVVYALVQTPGGTKMKMVAAPAEGSGTAAADGALLAISDSGQRWHAEAVQTDSVMQQIAPALGDRGRMLVDLTGLGSFYFQFDLQLSGDQPVAAQIERQLGLRLEQRNVPVKTYVVDSAIPAI